MSDLTPCYLDFICVKKAIRQIMVFPHGVVLIHDSIQLDSAREIQWNLHTYSNIAEEMIDNIFNFHFSLHVYNHV